MTNGDRERVRDFIEGLSLAHSDTDELDDRESLFLRGRLDSLAVSRLVVFLEENFGVDFVAQVFDIDRLDSIEQIGTFAGQGRAAAAE